MNTLDWDQQDEEGEDFNAAVGEFFSLSVYGSDTEKRWLYSVHSESEELESNAGSCGSSTKEEAQRLAVRALKLILKDALEVLS